MRKLIFVLAAVPALSFAQHAAADGNLTVPLIAQQQSQWCWAASGQMIMNYVAKANGKGQTPSQCQQANQRLNRTDCCNYPSSKNCNRPGWPVFNAWGYDYNVTNDQAISKAEIKNQVDVRKTPWGFSWGWDGGGGHMMVASGYSVDANGNFYVTVKNPWPPREGDEYTISYGEYVGGPQYNHVHWRDYYNVRGAQ
ncbi:papain-like cysteine protease family protein [Pendulispora albinea]|uniref:Papain like cysteine protease AvrRpt2 n=1 Tax=Pendulispora albinea TaxID=2741071 RepID=A0ABZ2M5L6_9BACT